MLEDKKSLADKRYPTSFAVNYSALGLPTFDYLTHNWANWISMMDITGQNKIMGQNKITGQNKIRSF
jgi:hypothetical protein